MANPSFEWRIVWQVPVEPYITVRHDLITTEWAVKQLVQWLILNGVDRYTVRRRPVQQEDQFVTVTEEALNGQTEL